MACPEMSMRHHDYRSTPYYLLGTGFQPGDPGLSWGQTPGSKPAALVPLFATNSHNYGKLLIFLCFPYQSHGVSHICLRRIPHLVKVRPSWKCVLRAKNTRSILDTTNLNKWWKEVEMGLLICSHLWFCPMTLMTNIFCWQTSPSTADFSVKAP